MHKPKLLIVADDESLRTQLKYALAGDHTLAFAGDRHQALAAVKDFEPEVVSLDLGLPPHADGGPGGPGDARRDPPSGPADPGDHRHRQQRPRQRAQGGTARRLRLPPKADRPRRVPGRPLRRAAFLHALHRESDVAAAAAESSVRFEDIFGNTPRMRETFTITQRVAKTDATVLIEGESGTGKELIARAVHSRSGRRDGPFVAINCGAIPETLLESELFGHERGAFTGAHVQRKGKFELADKGTLFLDEIGELLFKPAAAMNLSGPPLCALLQRTSADARHCVLVHDDMDLALGDVRIKREGGDAGHKGVRSILSSVGTGDLHRVRIGVRRPGAARKARDTVLQPFQADDEAPLAPPWSGRARWWRRTFSPVPRMPVGR
jgi:peptidyl-tRNA hydrolase